MNEWLQNPTPYNRVGGISCPRCWKTAIVAGGTDKLPRPPAWCDCGWAEAEYPRPLSAPRMFEIIFCDTPGWG